MKPRVSQRRPLACRECTKRKRKCDKQIPCSRCQRLKLDCTREVVQLRRHVTRHSSEVEFLESIRQELQGTELNKTQNVVRKLSERINSLGFDSSTTPQDQGSPTNEEVSLSFTKVQLPSSGTDPSETSLVTAIEHLAWGRSYGNCYPHRHCACQFHKVWLERASTGTASFQFAGSGISTFVNLPDSMTAKLLVSFHLTNVAWHHNCLHCPTFLDQCHLFWDTGECPHPQWIALYCSVLSTAVYCLHNSGKFRPYLASCAWVPEAQDLFAAMVNVLYSSDFLSDISLYAIQAIVISTEVAHNLGLSQLNATLFGSAIRIAECLGLHKIEVEATGDSGSGDDWLETVEKEVGKRVWCQMVIQDHFAIPFTDSYAINPAQYSTELPRNADDSDLKEMPDSIPTISTYTRVLARIAYIMPELADGLGPLKNRKPVHEQYKHVLQVDQKMRQLVRTIPDFLLRQDEQLEVRIPWLCIARQSLAVTSAEKIIMIHRPFIFRSFHSDIYAHTRRTCVSAAMTILREHENIVQTGELSLWTHTAFSITAAVILCFEIRAGPQNTIEHAKKDTYRILVQAVRDRLAQRQSDVLAYRGIKLLNAILPEIDEAALSLEQGTQNPPQRGIEFRDILQRFNSDQDSLNTMVERYYHGLGQVGSLDQEESQNQLHLLMEQDFEHWFNDIFSTTQAQAF